MICIIQYESKEDLSPTGIRQVITGFDHVTAKQWLKEVCCVLKQIQGPFERPTYGKVVDIWVATMNIRLKGPRGYRTNRIPIRKGNVFVIARTVTKPKRNPAKQELPEENPETSA